MKFILSLLLIQLLSVNSLLAREFTDTFKQEIRETDCRATVYNICSRLVAVSDIDQNPESLFTELKDVYTSAKVPERARLLEQARIDGKTLREFLDSEIAITKPTLYLKASPNGDLIIGTRLPKKMKGRFTVPPNIMTIKKDSTEYKKALEKYWWFKPH